jgi:phosphatidylserine/phosphatidylglycerophosphate/cardiolipin synthase-like enzyme
MSRTIHTRAGGPTHVLEDLLQTLLVTELLSPSQRFWLVSPWISDIPVLDNSTGSLAAVAPSAPSRHLRLSEVLSRLAESGSEVTVITRRGEPHNAHFLNSLSTLTNQVAMHEHPELHAKVLVSDRFVLSGSMNFTNYGLGRNLERVTLDIDAETIKRETLVLAKLLRDLEQQA